MADVKSEEPGDILSGEESRVTPIRFEELANKIYTERSYRSEKPKDLQCFFVGTRIVMDGSAVPMIGFYCEPGWVDRMRTRINLLGVNGLEDIRVGEHSLKGGFAEGVHTFQVWDFDVDNLSDPSVTEPIEEVIAKDILVAPDVQSAKGLGSWVADEGVKQRINDWFRVTFNDGSMKGAEFSTRKQRYDAYRMLRQAPYNTHDSPGYGIYTYKGVVEEASRKTKSVWNPNLGDMEEVPITFRIFTEDDVRWLEEHMQHLGMPIPKE